MTQADKRVRAILDLARARKVAEKVWDVLAASERKGFGAWRSISLSCGHLAGEHQPCNGDDATCNWHRDHAALQWAQVTAEVNRRLADGIPADWCICGRAGVHVYEPTTCRY